MRHIIIGALASGLVLTLLYIKDINRRLTDMQEIIHEIHGMTVMMSGTGRVGEVVR